MGTSNLGTPIKTRYYCTREVTPPSPKVIAAHTLNSRGGSTLYRCRRASHEH